MRVVIDTNVLISAFVSTGGYPATAIDLWLAGRFELVTSLWQIEEFRRVSRYDRVKKRLNRVEVGVFVNSLRKNALVLDELPQVEYSPDPDDNPIIAAALAGEAHYLVSGDKQGVQALGQVEGVKVLTVREFVRLFREEG